MAKTPKKANGTRPTSKQARGGTVKSGKKIEDTDYFSDEIDQGGDGEAGIDAELSTMIMDHFERRHAQKESTRSAAFQQQKNAIYAAARKNTSGISRMGTTYIEDARATFRDLKAQELSHKKPFKDVERLCTFQQAAIDSLFSVYSTLLDDLAARRSDQINTASEMLQNNPVRRQAALKKFSKKARTHFEEVKETEKVASDASALIKQYKNLLYT